MGISEIIYIHLYPIRWDLVNNLWVATGGDTTPKNQISADSDLLRIHQGDADSGYPKYRNFSNRSICADLLEL
jgi:hypothetical protein